MSPREAMRCTSLLFIRAQAISAPLSASSFHGSSVTAAAAASPVPRTRRSTLRMQKSELALEDDLIFVKPDPTKKTLRIGVVGAGRIGQVHATNITFRLKNAHLVGVSSGSRELAERCSLDHGCQPYTDYDEMLENPELDAVCICSASNQVRVDGCCMCGSALLDSRVDFVCGGGRLLSCVNQSLTRLVLCVYVCPRFLGARMGSSTGPAALDRPCSRATLRFLAHAWVLC